MPKFLIERNIPDAATEIDDPHSWREPGFAQEPRGDRSEILRLQHQAAKLLLGVTQNVRVFDHSEPPKLATSEPRA